jgi:hypothetical protein
VTRVMRPRSRAPPRREKDRGADGQCKPAADRCALRRRETHPERRVAVALAMALQANTIELRDRVRERVRADTFESYLADLELVEASAGRVVLRVGPTLAREASRRCGPLLAELCRQLFGSRRVLLAGDDRWFDLGEGNSVRATIPEPRRSPKAARPGRSSDRPSPPSFQM